MFIYDLALFHCALILKDNPPYFRFFQPFNPFPQCSVSSEAASCLLWPFPPVIPTFNVALLQAKLGELPDSGPFYRRFRVVYPALLFWQRRKSFCFLISDSEPDRTGTPLRKPSIFQPLEVRRRENVFFYHLKILLHLSRCLVNFGLRISEQ